ncbi:hexamerin [Bombus impatiens]|uniref:Hexamerin n=1 Tax=Bombus impatiens TaxID=132113 RepID=A0A6P3E3A5_BOMIM|nr:hexamerin [Bombus impatiens]
MKAALVIFASFCLLAQAVHQLPSQVADATYLTKQKNIYELFWHVDQPTVYHPELYQKARTFNIAENVVQYNDQEAVTEFIQLLKHGMLPRGQVFTVMNPEMHHQAVTLFRVLYSAKTFDVFYNTAVWARFYVNELMYTYALSVAVIHRHDTKLIKLPPLYEVLPHFFFNDDVMQRTYDIAMGSTVDEKKTVGNVDQYVLLANYSGWYLTRHNVPEQKLNYFTEDVGLNSFYFMINHDFPSFMSSKMLHTPQIRGEYYFFSHKQLLTRYYLERLCNDMGEISYVSVNHPIVTGYYPTMQFRNGLPFPQRETGAVVPLHMQKYVQMLQDLHTRISTAIDLGFVLDTNGNRVNIYEKNGLNVLGNIVQGNVDSINVQFYGQLDMLVRKIFGFGYESHVKNQVVPSALELWSTSLRDPVFYSIYKTILNYYHRYKENVPSYTVDELSFSGVTIQSVTVDKLVTYFDHFESLLSNGVSVRGYKEARNTLIQARQYRLNHKPFTYHITVNCDKATTGVVRIFLGPKYDEFGHEIDLVHSYMNFMQMDEFMVDLKSGINKIDRSSHESIFVVPDETASHILYKKLVNSIEDGVTFKYSEQPYGFPERLLLPKGKKGGMPYNLFVIISPVDQSVTVQVNSPIWGHMTDDGRSMGFPLDRPVTSLLFNVPNVHLTEVLVHHGTEQELNTVDETKLSM